jgi:hypothetical protein
LRSVYKGGGAKLDEVLDMVSILENLYAFCATVGCAHSNNLLAQKIWLQTELTQMEKMLT